LINNKKNKRAVKGEEEKWDACSLKKNLKKNY